MSLKTGFLALLATSLVALTGCQKISSQPGAGVEATVNGAPIASTLVDAIIAQQAGPGQKGTPEMRKGVVEQLAMQVLLAQEAVRTGVDRTPDVADQLEFTREQILAKAYVQDWVKKSQADDAALKAQYEKLKAAQGGVEFKARHILVEGEGEAVAIIAAVKKTPASFETLAREKSKDPGSREKGGDLGWFDPAAMVPEFGAALAKLQKGQVTDQPVKTQFGWHVIQLEDSREKAAPSFDDVKPMLQQQATQDGLRKLVEDLKSKAKIEYAKAPAPAVQPAQSPAK